MTAPQPSVPTESIYPQQYDEIHIEQPARPNKIKSIIRIIVFILLVPVVWLAFVYLWSWLQTTPLITNVAFAATDASIRSQTEESCSNYTEQWKSHKTVNSGGTPIESFAGFGPMITHFTYQIGACDGDLRYDEAEAGWSGAIIHNIKDLPIVIKSSRLVTNSLGELAYIIPNIDDGQVFLTSQKPASFRDISDDESLIELLSKIILKEGMAEVGNQAIFTILPARDSEVAHPQRLLCAFASAEILEVMDICRGAPDYGGIDLRSVKDAVTVSLMYNLKTDDQGHKQISIYSKSVFTQNSSDTDAFFDSFFDK